jgi:hypothetical protein
MLPYMRVALVGEENQAVSAVLKPLSLRQQGFWPCTYFPEPEVVPAGQAMHFPLASGTRVVDGWPELLNMESKRPLLTLHIFQTVTSLSKTLAPLNIYDISMTLETSQLPIPWLKSVALLRLIQCRVVMCEMRFACACVNVRMRSDILLKIQCHKDNTQTTKTSSISKASLNTH